MKTMMMMLVCLFALQGLAKADDDKPIEVNNLPQKAQTFIKQHFADAKISYAKVEEDFLDKRYDVIFVNGQKVEFDKKGEWLEVDCKFSVVPTAIIPEQIKKQVTQKFPEQKVVKIERDKKGYEVKLDNKLEIKFTKNFQIVGYDD